MWSLRLSDRQSCCHSNFVFLVYKSIMLSLFFCESLSKICRLAVVVHNQIPRRERERRNVGAESGDEVELTNQRAGFAGTRRFYLHCQQCSEYSYHQFTPFHDHQLLET